MLPLLEEIDLLIAAQSQFPFILCWWQTKVVLLGDSDATKEFLRTVAFFKKLREYSAQLPEFW